MRAALADSLLGEPLPTGFEPDFPAFDVPHAPKKKKPKSTRGTHRIEVTLDRIRPPIWRRLEVPSGLPLSLLHHVLQIAMGWEDCHLHQFERDGTRYEPPREESWGVPSEDTAAYSIGEVLPNKGDRLRYEYDFGDGWSHTILVEAIRSERCTEVRCLKGRRACPPENVGGPHGYGHALEILANPMSEMFQEYDAWIGSDFDPGTFDLEAVDRELRELPIDATTR